MYTSVEGFQEAMKWYDLFDQQEAAKAAQEQVQKKVYLMLLMK